MKSTLQPIVLNGQYGEGGSALVRTALIMSCLTEQPVRIHRIRGATRKPGLTAEDLTTLEILLTSTNAKVTGDTLDSEDLTFTPQRPAKAVTAEFDIGAHSAGKTPGNALVIAQAILPVLARTGAYSHVGLLGETFGNNTLTYDAFLRSTLRGHRAQGLYAFTNLARSGFGFGGQGQTTIEIEPSHINPFIWEDRKELIAAGAVITSTDAPTPTLRDAYAFCAKKLEDAGLPNQIDQRDIPGREAGFNITFWAHFMNGSGSGSATWQKGTSGTNTAQSAWENFNDWFSTPATVDTYLADQLLITACLAEGKTTYTTPVVTKRLTTIAWVIKQFLPIHVTIKGRENTPGTIIVER